LRRPRLGEIRVVAQGIADAADLGMEIHPIWVMAARICPS
jgi:hypothetical protein